MKCLDVGWEDIQEVGVREMKYLDVVKEDIQEVGAREDEVFGCVGRRHSGGRSEGR